MALDPSLLAFGGLAAVVTAGWAQVKAVLTQLRSIIFVKGYLSPGLNSYVSMHLRKTWKQLPTSDVEYGVTYLTLGTELVSRMIAFRLPPYKVAIFYKGWRVVMLLDNDNLVTLRGMVNLDELVLAGVKLHDDFMNEDTRPNRYMKMDVMGQDVKQSGRRGKHLSNDATDSDSPSLASGSHRNPDPQFDTPLGYTREQVLNTKTKFDPFQTLVYEPHVMRHVEQAEQWFNRRDWYNSRGIPWRRGWQLYGPPGTGKSRLCRAMAQRMQIPIYCFHLNTMSDQEFMEEWRNIAFPAVVVFEDFDNVFHGRVNVRAESTLSFDCVLNQISGIGTNDGLFLIVTTNHPELMDSAMGSVAVSTQPVEGAPVEDDEDLSSRPGRIDVSIYLGYISQEGKRVMANRILDTWPVSAAKLATNTRELTGAQFEELCVREAQRQLAAEEAARLAHPEEETA